MDVTEAGMATLVRPLQLVKAWLAIVVTGFPLIEAGIDTSPVALAG
jgi:hypothetical protein